MPPSFQRFGESHCRAAFFSVVGRIPSPRHHLFSGPANPIAAPQSFQRAGVSHRRTTIFSAVRRTQSFQRASVHRQAAKSHFGRRIIVVPPFYLRRRIIVVHNSSLVRHIITKPPFYLRQRIIVVPSYHILTSASSPPCHILSRPVQSVATPYFFCAHHAGHHVKFQAATSLAPAHQLRLKINKKTMHYH